MRRGLLTAAAFGLAGAAGAASGQSPPPSGAGCLGAPVQACVAALRASMTLQEGLLAASLERRHHVDVNGRSLGDVVTATGRLPSRVETVKIVLNLSPDDRVAAAAATLLRDPSRARTEQEYAETGLYDIALRLAGNRCPDNTPLALYRFFENSVKPRLAASREDARGAVAGKHREVDVAERVPYCGINFTYVALRGWSGAADPGFAAKATETYTIRFDP